MVCALNVNHRNGLASAQVAPTDDIILPRIPHAHDAHASLLASVIVPRAQQRGSFHAPFLAMAEPKQASLCSFGLTKRLSLFRSVAYLPLVQKLFHVVKVVFVVLKMALPEFGVTRPLTHVLQAVLFTFKPWVSSRQIPEEPFEKLPPLPVLSDLRYGGNFKSAFVSCSPDD